MFTTKSLILRADQLVRTYRARDVAGRTREVHALRGVDVAVARGGSLAIVGESGSGKSTLARILVGMEAPDSGSVFIDGENFHTAQPYARRQLHRRIQMVFQDPYRSLNPRLSIRSALRYAFRASQRSRGEFDGECERLLRMVRIPLDYVNRRPTGLSGGERQRINIARALMVRPDIIVADEAVSALDRSVQADVLNLIADLRTELGLTLLYITHDLHTVQAVCEDVIVMNQGVIVERGSSREVLLAPSAEYTRELVDATPTVQTALARRTAPIGGGR